MLVNKIGAVVIRKRSHLAGSFSDFFCGAGFGVILLDIFNNLTNHDLPYVKERVVWAGLSIFSGGALLRLLNRKVWHIGNRRVLHVVDTNPV